MGSRSALDSLLNALIDGWPFDLDAGESIKFLPSAHDRGFFQIGDGTTDMDVKVFLGSPSVFVLFDVGNQKLTLTGVTLEADGSSLTGNTTLANVTITGVSNTQGNATFANAVFTGTTNTQGNATLANAIFTGTVNTQGNTVLTGNTSVVGNATIQTNTVFGIGNSAVVGLSYNGTYLEGRQSGLWTDAPSKADPNYDSIAHELFDDFNKIASTTTSDVVAWTRITGAGGTDGFQDAAAGILNVVTAAVDNDHVAWASPLESNLFIAGKKLWFEARFRLNEATTNESAWWFGLTDTVTTGGFQADALGPLASYGGALVWKDEATLEIDCETSNAGTQVTNTNVATFVSNAFTKIGFYFDGTAVTSNILFYVDDVLVATGTISLAGLGEMHVVFGVKAGPTAAAETLQVDYVKCLQLR